MHGWNPVDYLRIEDPTERTVARLALQKAEDIASERRQAFIKAITVAVQNGVAKAFGG